MPKKENTTKTGDAMMFSKEKFNKILDSAQQDLSDDEKKQMYEVMAERLNDHKQKPGSSGMGPQGMMMEMMGKMMGGGMKGGNSPMSRCMDMMAEMKQKDQDMPYSTDELMDLFKDWCRQVEDEIADFIAASGEVNTDKIAEKFHLSKESVVHLLRNIEKSPK
jgi:hypothetical protein